MSKGNIETLTKRLDALEQQIALLSNTETKTSLKTPKADKPKKKPSGYNLFCKEMRNTAKTALQNDSTGEFKPTDIMKRLGSMWKDLTDDQRLEWNSKANNTTI